MAGQITLSKNRSSWLLVVLISMLIGSCVEKIEFPLNKGLAKLVVSGQVSNLQENRFVFLSETTSKDRKPVFSGNYYVLNDLPNPVSEAELTLVGEDGSQSNFTEIEPGKYQLEASVEILNGVAYYLDIVVQGERYQSIPESLPEQVGEDELSYTFSRDIIQDQPETAFISIHTTTTLPSQKGGYYFRWDVDEVYYWDLTFFPNPFNQPPPDCYVFGFPDPQRISLLNGDLINSPGGKSTQLVAERILDDSFLSRHYFNVRLTSLNKSAFEYWRKVRELVNNSGSVFDTPPAPIYGNIQNVNRPDEVVLGNFEIARVSQKRIYTTRADVPFFEEEVCTYDPQRPYEDYPKTCLRCSEFPSSTNATPHWWFDQ
ncbi:uncharacterized protein DUF4249 [Algoriphagus chordae]|uniref:Uncharacterized protein DUF4249 n=2 Tax=Algoriphagus chordae TaxID=237019 RepID=A0A2W7R1Z6_9BACT|nr:uncharacterized protein DUF4249 [Algoriphagus chordae]